MGGAIGPTPLDWDYDTFTAGMAKRAAPGPFETAPIAQGHWDGTGTPDVLSLGRGTQFGNPTGVAYANLDSYQGTIAFWVTPEWNGNDGKNHILIDGGTFEQLQVYKTDASWLYLWMGGQFTRAWAGGWTAGTRYFVVCRWDSRNTLDGTNYACISINDVHTYGMTTAPTIIAPSSTLGVGYDPGDVITAADALIEGLTIYRRVLYDGTYGVPATFNASGPVDEIAAMHAAGAGADPCLTTGSWDVVFCLPTDSTEGALTTGTGEAWSHPHTSEVVDHFTLEDGFYGGGQWAVVFNGTSTSINCGSAAALDDLPAGANGVTYDGWIRFDGYTTYSRWFDKTNIVFYWESTTRLQCYVITAGTDAISRVDVTMDGKWHHVAVSFESQPTGGDGKIYIAIDGRWTSTYVQQIAGTLAYSTDAAFNFYIGNIAAGNRAANGALGWLRLSNINTRYTVGTDFIPPREFPAADGNTVEAWSLNDGTGATIVAQVTSPGNDGTASNHTWEQQWDDVLTPVYPTSLEFDGSATVVNCGSGATLDDLHDNAFTAECWVRVASTGSTSEAPILDKGSISAGVGWEIRTSSNGAVKAFVRCATTDAYANSSVLIRDGRWHHIAIAWDDAGARTIGLYVDGILAATSNVGAGLIDSDAAQNLVVGLAGAYKTAGAFSWIRLSNNRRYTANFVPPDRATPPAVDGNTVEQWNFQVGAGTTITAQVTSPANDGAITMGAGRWWNTPDMVTDSPGSRIYQWGYAIGSDGAGDGVHQHLAGQSAGSNYVVRLPLRYEADKRAKPRIEIYDETNGASITQFNAPFLTGTHDGGAAHAHLHDSTAPYWPYSLIGGTVYNITDGSSGPITGCGTQITATLAGGGSNDWNNGEVYFIVPPARWVFAEPFTFELPTIARNGSAADCTHISVRLLNQAGEGTVYWEQVEVLANLMDNPSLETGAGVPWIPDGWTNSGLDPGDSVASSAGGGVIHSGSDCIEFAVGASGGEAIYQDPGGTVGNFVGIGSWGYFDGVKAVYFQFANVSNGVLQYSPTVTFRVPPNDAVWIHTAQVGRVTGALMRTMWLPEAGAAGLPYLDDTYIVGLDNVSLTATPASAANSLETSGLRVDGQDLCSWAVPAGRLSIGQGWLRWNWTPRHSAALLASYAGATNLPYIARAWGDANNDVLVEVTAANTIQLDVTAGAVNATQNWNCAGAIVAGTTYKMELRWDGAWFRLLVDDVIQAQVSPALLTTVPGTIYWGCDATPEHEADATYAAP